jgi:hypothetical protein
MVPVLESGVNWVYFERRIEEYLVMSGLGITMSPEFKPPKINQPAVTAVAALPASNGRAAVAAVAASPAFVETDLAYISRLVTTSWGEKQSRGCMAIRSRCGYNPYNAVKDLKTVYEMIEALRKLTKTSGTGALIDLTSRFYAKNLSDCKNVTEFSSTLSQVNNELKDLHPEAAFTEVQLVLRFLQGLGSAFDTFKTTFQQTHNLLKDGDKEAVTFQTVVQKAFDAEQLELSNASSGGVALIAQDANGRPAKYCTHCKVTLHDSTACWHLHPHLKAEHRARIQKRYKRKLKGDDSGAAKKAKTSNNSTTEEDSTAIAAVMCLALDSETQSAEDTALPAFDTPVEDTWVVDTGCTNHATGSMKYFTDFSSGSYGTCGGIGDSKINFEGKGTCSIPVRSKGKTVILQLTDVKFCPALGNFNLISVSQLFKKTTPKLTKDSISWTVGGYTINSTAQNGLWLLDVATGKTIKS